jgi:hypothetical protein
MNDDTRDDALLREFLLGKVNDEERERIEGLFLTDSQEKERLLAVEQDLIEDYLEGTLTTADNERFVERYSQTPEQQRKLRITKSIKDWAIAEAAAAQTAPIQRAGWRGWRSRLWRKPAFVIPIAVTALIVIVVAGIWLSRQAKHSAIEQELVQLNSPSNPQGPVGLELSPVTVRGAESPPPLSTQAGEAIELRLLWIQKERSSKYQATIHRVDDTESFLIPNLQPESDGKAIRVKLTAHMLTRGTYQIILNGLAPDGNTSSTEEYQFTVGG